MEICRNLRFGAL